MGPGSRGNRGWILLTVSEKKVQRLSRKVHYSFQAEIHATLTCTHEIQMNARPEKCVSIFSDSQAALKALQAVKTTSPLVQQCQKALNDISTRHSVRMFWVPGHSGL
jgi:ribonuclease HI